MATLDDLPIPDFSQLSDEQLQELILKTRDRRRNPDKAIKAQSVKKAVARKKQGKAVALKGLSDIAKNLTPEQAKELLAQLRSGNGKAD